MKALTKDEIDALLAASANKHNSDERHMNDAKKDGEQESDVDPAWRQYVGHPTIIARLKAEIAKLTANEMLMCNALGSQADYIDKMEEAHQQTKAENARLREALEKIEDTPADAPHAMIGIAARALEPFRRN